MRSVILKTFRIIKVKSVKLWNKYTRHKTKIKIIKYLSNESNYDKLEKEKIIGFLKKNPLPIFPYHFTKKYNQNNIIVYMDNVCGIRYIIQEGKKLYFKKKWDENKIKSYYNSLLLEQDINSPHRYESEEFCVKEGDVVIDAGVAEGNFALSVVEKVKKMYLFEADEEWMDALRVTFAPWKEKVEIICKYVSDNNENNNIKLDTLLGKQKIDFLKADIEGSEMALLKGSQHIISENENIKIILCTYHNQNDAEELNRKLLEFGFQTEFSRGYMIFWYDKTLCEPYLRKGLVRGIKV